MSVAAFWSCFVPIFVAVDPIGTLPLYLHLTGGMKPARQRRIILQSTGTAAVVALAFLYGGQALFRFLGITLYDFMIAGGILLFVISMSDLLSGEKPRRGTGADGPGIVPLGVPIIAGPAVLTAIVMLAGRHGSAAAAAAMLVNVGLAGAVFWFSELFRRRLGENGMKAFSKVMSLVLAAFAVRMIREGLQGIWPVIGG
ncbi:MAG: multiple antibiotic resistance (MarC)-like protein [Candidatus Omnitrophica bacterium CG11_big_fil_rev_8_21_14_0_20_64_10]|nr:MAG: multiple antibiotic resistance (MarC)-like protein [Candidatus Omnitrophica bacterium CG11_big_fil_rev_8_21_14_0_20_64_10]